MTDTDLGPQDTEPAKGLDAILENALDNFGEEPTAVAQEPKDTEQKELKTDATGRLHGDGGKFAKKVSAEAKPSDKEPAAEAKTAEAITTEPPHAEPIQPPARWSEADKADFARLSPEGQKLFLARYNAIEGDYTRKTQEIAEQRKRYEPLISKADKWSPYFQQIGMTPDAALDALAQAEYTLRNGSPAEKQAVFARLAHDYGVAPFTGQQPQGYAQPQSDPTVATLLQEVQALKQHQELSENQKVQSEIESFRQAKAQDGSPQYPHFERVRETMGRLIDGGHADDLPTAYAKAVRLDDELFKETVESERKRVADEAERARMEAVEKAKKASPVRSSDGSPKGGAQLKGLDAHLDAAMQRLAS